MVNKIQRKFYKPKPYTGGYSLTRYWDSLDFDQKAIWLTAIFFIVLIGVPFGLWIYWTYFATPLDVMEWMENLDKRNKKNK